MTSLYLSERKLRLVAFLFKQLIALIVCLISLVYILDNIASIAVMAVMAARFKGYRRSATYIKTRQRATTLKRLH